MKRLFKVREVLKRMRNEGWYIARQNGSHRQMKHPIIKRTATVSGALNDDIAPKTLESIENQSGIKFKE